MKNLLTVTDASGTISLPVGYYWLTVKLGNASGYAIKTELVHIYQDRTTKITDITSGGNFSFSSGDFSKLETASFTVSASGAPEDAGVSITSLNRTPDNKDLPLTGRGLFDNAYSRSL